MNDVDSSLVNRTHGLQNKHDLLLFWGCFVALIATAFGFIVRAMIIDDWAVEFNLTETQKGEIFGVGLWPFAISIIVLSLLIDKIGYGRAMALAFISHAASLVITITATGYTSLYIGQFLVGFGNGAVEAVINPLVATLFIKDKTKWLNILHAGWPGGLVLGGLLALSMGDTGIVGQLAEGPISWKWKVGILILPVIAYGLMLIPCKFPVNERVTAGVSYRDMLRETGVIGAIIISSLVVWELSRVFLGDYFVQNDWSFLATCGFKAAVAIALVIPFAVFVRFDPGRWVFLFLLIIMIPLATTEVGTDSWITSLMVPEMEKLGVQAGWVLVYTSFIMTVLRFCAGPIVEKLSPLGLLALCSAVAVAGLIFLSKTTGIMIFAAATLYGFGKTFFWPTMLGVVAERYPRGGAMSINSIAAVGILGVGVIGSAMIGNVQDKQIDHTLRAEHPDLHTQVAGKEKVSVFGTYKPVDKQKLDQLDRENQETVETIQATAKKDALKTIAILPAFTLVCFVLLILYFRAKGGYTVVHITEGESPPA